MYDAEHRVIRTDGMVCSRISRGDRSLTGAGAGAASVGAFLGVAWRTVSVAAPIRDIIRTHDSGWSAARNTSEGIVRSLVGIQDGLTSVLLQIIRSQGRCTFSYGTVTYR